MTGSSAAVGVSDVDYLSIGDVRLRARIYQPASSGPHPAIVDVHGGQWTKYDRLQNESIHLELAARGIVVAALDFRMPPVATYPLPVADINYGIRWFKANAENFGTRGSLIGGLGTSSGGHQLMLNVLRPDDPRYAGINGFPGVDASLRFAIVGWGVVDPVARYAMAKRGELNEIVASHDAYWPSIEAMAEGSPQAILGSASGALPPLLYLQGDRDDNLTPDMADRFVRAYRAAGGDARLESFAGEPHTFVTKTPSSAAAARARERIIAFVYEQTSQ